MAFHWRNAMCFFDFDTNWITSLFNAQKINIWSVSWIYKFFYFLFIKDINDKVNWHIFFLQGKHKQALSMANLTDISLFIRSDVMLLIMQEKSFSISKLFVWKTYTYKTINILVFLMLPKLRDWKNQVISMIEI